jgi:hypothetical protein
MKFCCCSIYAWNIAGCPTVWTQYQLAALSSAFFFKSKFLFLLFFAKCPWTCLVQKNISDQQHVCQNLNVLEKNFISLAFCESPSVWCLLFKIGITIYTTLVTKG